jgi:hypothetical protein
MHMVDLTCVQQASTPSKQQSCEDECTSLLVNSLFKKLPNLNNKLMHKVHLHLAATAYSVFFIQRELLPFVE